MGLRELGLKARHVTLPPSCHTRGPQGLCALRSLTTAQVHRSELSAAFVAGVCDAS